MEIVSKWNGFVRRALHILRYLHNIYSPYTKFRKWDYLKSINSTTKFVKIWHSRCEMVTFHICDDAYMLVIIYWWKESWYSIMRKQTKFSFAVPTIVPWEIREEIWLWWHTFLLCEEDTNIIHKKGANMNMIDFEMRFRLPCKHVDIHTIF